MKAEWRWRSVDLCAVHLKFSRLNNSNYCGAHTLVKGFLEIRVTWYYFRHLLGTDSTIVNVWVSHMRAWCPFTLPPLMLALAACRMETSGRLAWISPAAPKNYIHCLVPGFPFCFFLFSLRGLHEKKLQPKKRAFFWNVCFKSTLHMKKVTA